MTRHPTANPNEDPVREAILDRMEEVDLSVERWNGMLIAHRSEVHTAECRLKEAMQERDALKAWLEANKP